MFADEPYAYLPDVPTIKQASGVDVPGIGASMRGIAVPKGMSPERKRVLQKAFASVMKDPEFLARTEKMGLPLSYMDADTFSAYLSTAEDSVKGYVGLLK